MTVRLRIRELMKASGFRTAYQLAQAVDERVSEPTIYRLVRSKGEVGNIRADTLEALAAVFGCEVPDLFERGNGRSR